MRAVTKMQRAERKSDGRLRDGKRVKKSNRAVKKPRNKETGLGTAIKRQCQRHRRRDDETQRKAN